MYTTSMMFRIAKTLSVTGIGLMGLLVVAGNLTDYYSNFHFVEHVMKMDTTFRDSRIHYRSIHSPFVYHAGYIMVILFEMAMTFCCLKGSWQMFRNLKKEGALFHESKKWAVGGIIIGILIWFIGFEVIGGEWFAMWQSAEWNGLAAAERVLSFLVLVLILLHFKDD